MAWVGCVNFQSKITEVKVDPISGILTSNTTILNGASAVSGSTVVGQLTAGQHTQKVGMVGFTNENPSANDVALAQVIGQLAIQGLRTYLGQPLIITNAVTK